MSAYVRVRSGDTKLEGVINYVLMIGVVTSLLLEIAGLLLFYLNPL